MTVVAAAIMQYEDKFFIAQRPEGKSLAYHWEFPGGKQESGETLPEALKRELKEELNIDVTIGDFFMKSDYQYGFGMIEIYCYFVPLSQKTDIVSNEHLETKWVTANELKYYKFAPADEAIVAALQKYQNA